MLLGGLEGRDLVGVLRLEQLVALDDLLEGLRLGPGVLEEPQGPCAKNPAEEGETPMPMSSAESATCQGSGRSADWARAVLAICRFASDRICSAVSA